MKKKKYFKNIILVLGTFLFLFFAISCDKSKTKDNDSTNSSSDVEIEKYTVTFDSNGGSSVDSQTISNGGKVVQPSNPSKSGYEFEGWYYNGEKWDFAKSKVTENITLEARWSAHGYILNLENNKPLAGDISDSGSYDYNEQVTIVASPYLGYEFDGWYEDDNLISNDESYTFSMPSRNKTYEAKWNLLPEMENFEFSSTLDSLTITGIKDKTVKKIMVPDYVTNINEGVFNGCSSLESITMPFIGAEIDSLEIFGYIFGTDSYNGSYGALYIDSVTSHNISTNIYYIPRSLKEVKITKSNYIIQQAFSYCELLTSIELPNSVEFIGSAAFNNCSSLTSIKIPENVRYIGASAFASCNKLSSIEIPNGITEIDNGTFNNCSSLTSVVIPNGVTSIGESAFENCSSLTSIVIPNSVTSIGELAFGFCDKLTSVVIPNSVTSIGNSAFTFCSKLTSVDMSNRVTKIGRLTFSGCEKLTNIELPNGLMSIEDSAFNNCSSLTSIVIPNGVTSIESMAFNNCSSLTSVAIPNSVTSIGSYVFKNCSSLTSVRVGNGISNLSIGVFSGCSSLESITLPFVGSGASNSNPFGYIFGNSNYEGSIATTQFGQIYYIPSSLKEVIITGSTSIPNSAFADCTQLRRIELPNGITSIENVAFYNCSSLTSVTIPNSVTSIEYNAFEKCYHLVEIFNLSDLEITIGSGSYGGIGYYALKIHDTIEESVITSIDDKYVFAYLDDKAYLVQYIGNETELILPETIVINGNTIADYGINKNAFIDCSSLQSIVIPNSVTCIRKGAFNGCSSLKSMTMPFVVEEKNNEMENYQYPFGYIFGSSSYDGGVATIQRDVTYYIPNSLREVTIIDSTDIPDYAFQNCSLFTSITIPDNLDSIGDYAFAGCIKITRFTIPEGVTSIGYYSFKDCKKITNIIIPNSITRIDGSVFSGCSSLKSITLPFAGSGNVYSYEFGYIFGPSSYEGSVEIIQNGRPYYIPTALEEVVITGSTNISNHAFQNCSSLKRIKIGNSVTSIEKGAFSGCSSLESITLPFVGNKRHSPTDTYQYPLGYIFGSENFDGSIEMAQTYYGTSMSSDTATFYIPETLKEVIIVGTSYIPPLALSNFTSLTRIEIGDGIINIGDGAFDCCSSLESIVISNTVTNIGDYAFMSCHPLQNVYYKGTSEQWNNISIGSDNELLTSATIYYYSEEEPINAGNYWHYVNGQVTIW